MPPPRRPSDRRQSERRPATAAQEEAASLPRIIGGTLRGRPLAFAPTGQTRPMKDRVREALFNLLGPGVTGAVALDLFAGTGALGFEAVSRGAERAIFVERHFPTADAIKKTARSLGIEDRVEVRTGDVLLWARRLPPLPTDRPWVIFVSPPWSFFGERWAELASLIDAVWGAAPAGSLMVVEADTSFDAAQLPDRQAWESRPLPPAVLHIRR
jgi:16S rRNA (guanine966-N2)-methyltransferase